MMLYVHSILFISKVATAAHRTDPTKKTKSLRHKHRPGTQSHLLFRFLLVFLSAFAGEKLIKIIHYAQAASYHHQQAYHFSMPIQQFLICSSSFLAFLGFQQAHRQAASLLSVSWHPGFCLRFQRLVRSLFSIRPSLALFTALLGQCFKIKSPARNGRAFITKE